MPRASGVGIMSDDICDSPVWGQVGWTAPVILSRARTSGAVKQLVGYFAPAAAGVCDRMTGASFNDLGGGGDRPETADIITGDDIVAVRSLSVAIPTAHCLQLLGSGVTRDGLEQTRRWREGLGHNGALQYAEIPSIWKVPIDACGVNAALERIPKNKALADIPAQEISSILTSVDLAWREIRRKDRTGPDTFGQTTVSKILARKRPHLLPIIDSEITGVLNYDSSGKFYRSMWKVMSDEELALPAHLAAIRNAAYDCSGDERIRRLSDLRVFDIVVWMEATSPTGKA